MVEVKETYFKYRKSLLLVGVAQAKIEYQKTYVDVLEERRLYGEMEMSKVMEEYEKLSLEEYGLLTGENSYFLALTELNKVVGIPNYFKPRYENQEYEAWQKEVAADEASRKVQEEYLIKEQALLKEAEKAARLRVKEEKALRKN